MVENKTKTKAAMLNELESIKGLLLEADDIPILQEIIEPKLNVAQATTSAAVSMAPAATPLQPPQPDAFSAESFAKSVPPTKVLESVRPASTRNLMAAKGQGENPFLPEHIRSRLHGNNPPPMFEEEIAKQMALSPRPSRFLGGLSLNQNTKYASIHLHEIIDSIIARVMPEIERELRDKLSTMSRDILEDLDRHY